MRDEQWYCPRDDAWVSAAEWRVEEEDDPGHRMSWHHCPTGHGFPGRSPYSSPDAETKARRADGTPIDPPERNPEGPVPSWDSVIDQYKNSGQA